MTWKNKKQKTKMKNFKSKLVTVFVIFTFLISFFFLEKSNFTLPAMALVSSNETEQNGDLSFWDVIKPVDKSLSVDVWSFLKIDLSKWSEIELLSHNVWIFTNWAAFINSLFDFDISFSQNSSLKLDNSSVFIKKSDTNIKIVWIKWTSLLKIQWQYLYITPWYWVDFDNEKFEEKGDMISILHSLNYKKTSIVDLSDKDVNAYLTKFNYFNKKAKNNPLTFFKKQESEIDFKNKMYLFKECTDVIWDYLDGISNALEIKSVCYKDEIISDRYLNWLLLRNINFSKNITDNYDLKSFYYTKNKKDLSLFDYLIYLEKGLKEWDMDFSKRMISNIKNNLKNFWDKKNLISLFISYDSIIKHHSSMLPNEALFLRWSIEDIILKEFNKDLIVAKYVYDYHFDFVWHLLDERDYLLLDTLFNRRSDITYPTEKKDFVELSYLFSDRMETLWKSYDDMRSMDHWTALTWDALEKNTKDQEEKEDRIKEFIKSLSEVEAVRVANSFRLSDLTDLLTSNDFMVDENNIDPYMKWGSLFKLAWVNYKWILFDANFNFENESFDSVELHSDIENAKVKKASLELKKETLANLKAEPVKEEEDSDIIISEEDRLKKDIEALEKEVQYLEDGGVYKWWSFVLNDFWGILESPYEKDLFNEKPSDVFADISDLKEFSYADILKSEMLRVYLDNVWIYSFSKDIEEISRDFYRVKRASVSTELWNVNISFDIFLDTWIVSNLILQEYPDKDIYTSVAYWKDIKNAVSIAYKNIVDYKNNKEIIASRFKWFIFTEESVKPIDETKTDWFNIDSSIRYSSWEIGIKWKYYVEKDLFPKVEASIDNKKESWENIDFWGLISELDEFNIDIVRKEKIVMKTQKAERIIDYSSAPDELINWDWINDL